MSRILVTGGAGFIGSHLLDAILKKGHEVIVLDNFSTGRQQNLDHVADKIQLIECDISQKGNWQDYFKNVKWVFHLAALADIVPSIERPNDYYQSNVNGTFNVLEACRKHHVKKIVYSASSSCYGIPDEYPTKETAEIRPQYPYALTKYFGEQLVMHWCQVYDLPAVSLRFFNVYGPRSRTSGTYGAVFGVFLAQKLAGKPFTVVGDGTQTRCFCHVSDVVEGLVALSEHPEAFGRVFNLGGAEEISIGDLAERIIELAGSDSEVEYISYDTAYEEGFEDMVRRVPNTDRARQLVGFEPSVGLDDIIRSVIEDQQA